jgi:two-component system, cell cycle sensor histidine kinase and response regulator CckA
MKVLVVEQEPLVGQALKFLLVGAAWEVDLCCPAQVVARAQAASDRPVTVPRPSNPSEPDLIVIDGGGELNGLGPALRSHHPHTPLLLLTATPQPQPPWATATLAKPVEATALVDQVRALVEPIPTPVDPQPSAAQLRTLLDTVYHQAEIARRESEEKYRLLFESIDEGFCVVEMVFDVQQTPVDFRFLDINPAFPQQSGLTQAQGRCARELVPDLEDFWLETYGQVAQTGEPVRFEHYAAPLRRCFDGFAFRLGAAERGQVAILFRDVTQRRQAEEALQASERKLRAVFDSTFEFMGLLQVDGTVVDANRAALRVIGCDRTAVVGRPFWQTPWWAHCSDQRRRLRWAIDRAAQGETVQMETEHRWPDGTTAWVDFSIKPVLDDEGQVVMLVPEGRDITGRKQAERKIREQAALLDIASDAISVRDLNHRILYWNQGAERLYGFSQAEARGQRAYDLLDSDPTQHSEITPLLLQRGEWRGELTKRTKTGQALTVAARWTLVRDEAGQPKLILAVETDITEKKSLEAQFYQAQRLESLGRLASGIAHDLNNVFTPIVTITQLLRLAHRAPTSPLDAQAQDQLRLLEESAQRGASMVQQILSITRSSSGEGTELDLGPLLHDLGRMLQQSLPKSIQLLVLAPQSTGPQGPDLRIYADPTHLHQVIMNLCVNARDAMPQGGTLTLAVDRVGINAAQAQARIDAQAGEYGRVTVTDTGTGIAPELRDRIFDPFFTTKPPGQGTGLGLATVLGLVRASGGFIQVDTTVGQGTAIQVYLPALVETPDPDATDRAPCPSGGPAAPPEGQGELLLVVEDDVSVQHSVRSLLLSYNYQVLVAANGLEALDCLTQHQPRLAVLDMMMPGMDGVTLIQRLQHRQPNLNIIATSGLPTYEDEALAVGAKAFLLKPYNLIDLLTTIAHLLR